jgi:acetyl-CoA carboxylase biotin carboxylase subunit
MFNKVVVANRGAVASRIIRALRTMGIRSVAVFSDADADLPYLKEADEAYRIGGPHAKDSYLNQEAILAVIKETKADAVHPGYGFLSENPAFARQVEQAGATFIGPSSRYMEAMAHKSEARKLAARYGMPTGAGSDVLGDAEVEIVSEARRIGYPVLVKPAAGGGGIGMIPAYDEDELIKAVARARSLANRSFSSSQVYLEKYMERPRHIEFQMLADRQGNVCHLFERDCSLQRRHQKIIEESPAPCISREEIGKMADTITEVVRRIGYDNIGTTEFLRDQEGSYSFLEMNTRLQVEHAVTEEVTGIDLVRAQIESAAGKRLSDIIRQPVAVKGHAIEARIYAEDPLQFIPSPGKLLVFRPPGGEAIRVETGYAEGNTVTTYYDPMIAKVIACGDSRQEAVKRLVESLQNFEISGIKTNIPFLLFALASEEYQQGSIYTGLTNELVNRMKQTAEGIKNG